MGWLRLQPEQLAQRRRRATHEAAVAAEAASLEEGRGVDDLPSGREGAHVEVDVCGEKLSLKMAHHPEDGEALRPSTGWWSPS